MPDFRLSSSGVSSYDQSKTDFTDFALSSNSLQQTLLEQINLQNLNNKEIKIAEYIIGNLNENGYLESTLQSISDDLIFQQNIDTTQERIENVLEVIQGLEPAGVGARNL